MKISAIQNNNQTFGATIIKTSDMQNAIEYMSSHRMRPGQKDFTEHFYLWNKIEYAMLNHPSQVAISTKVRYIKGQLFGDRGVIKTVAGEYQTNEPARSDSIASVLNVWRDFLNPENKDKFNKLVGTAYEKGYNQWWEKFIAPYWEGINKFYREEL